MPHSVETGPCGSRGCYRTAGRGRLRRAPRELAGNGAANPVPPGVSSSMLVRNVPEVPMAQGCEFLERLEAVAAAHPDRPALLTADRAAVSYRELLAAADRLAAELVRGGAGPERLVGIGLGRSAGFVTAVLGCWRAGAAFLPL